MLLTRERGGHGRITLKTSADGSPTAVEWEQVDEGTSRGSPLVAGGIPAIVETARVVRLDRTTLVPTAEVDIPEDWASCDGFSGDLCGQPCALDGKFIYIGRNAAGSGGGGLLEVNLETTEVLASSFEAQGVAWHCFGLRDRVFVIVGADPVGSLFAFDPATGRFLDAVAATTTVDGLELQYPIGGGVDAQRRSIYVIGFTHGRTPIVEVDVSTWPAPVGAPNLPQTEEAGINADALFPIGDGRLLASGIGGDGRQALAILDLRGRAPTVDILYSSTSYGGRIRVSQISESLYLATGMTEGPQLVDIRGRTYPELSSALPDDTWEAVRLPVTPE